MHLKEGRSLSNVISDLEMTLSFLDDCEGHFNQVPHLISSLSAEVIDVINRLEIEIEEDKQQEEYEFEQRIKTRNLFMKNKLTA